MPLARSCLAALAALGITMISSSSRGQPPKTFSLSQEALQKIEARTAATGMHAKIVGPKEVGAPQTVGPSTVLHVGQFVETTAAEETTQVDGRKRVLLPYRFFGKNASGEDLELAPVIEIDGGGLRLVPSKEIFEGTVRVGIEDLNHGEQNVPLPSNTRIEFFTDASRVDPRWIEVVSAGIPYSPVTLELQAPKESVEFRLKMSFREDLIEAEVPVIRPKIELSMPSRIPGLGVGSANVVVSIPMDAGSKRRQVELELQKGELESLLLLASPNDAASTRLRSQGLGPTEIVAKSEPLVPASATIVFVVPTAFLLAALGGGAVGAIITGFARKRKGLFRHLVAGALMGLVVAALFVLGVNITQISLPTQSNELAVFAIAAFGGIAVVPLLAKYAPSASPTSALG